jgi:hypothetical protein
MKKIFGLAGIMLAAGLVLTGCAKSTYHLQWGAAFIPYARVQSIIASEGWAIAESGDSWALAAGDAAGSVYEYCMATVRWIDNGEHDGSFEEAIGFSQDGVSAPPDLVTAANKIKRRVPVVGIFDAGGSGIAVMFYITKN